MRNFTPKYWLLFLCLAALNPRAVGQIVGHTYDPLTGATTSFSNATFSGRIIDSLTRDPLPGAVISVVTPNASRDGETAVRNYTTDKKGQFAFTAHAGRNIRMEISFLGYKIRTVWLGADQPELHLGEIKMSESVHEIDKVVVKARMHLYKMKGDTTIYFPKAIKTMEGDKALEILRNMPGVEVSDNGGVTIQGKVVARTYVNSRLLFGEQPTTALKQLEAVEVASIEAYDEVDEDEARKHGEHARKRKVLNIITFEKFSRSISATARAEAGADFDKDAEGLRKARYAAIADAGYYSETTQAIIKGTTENMPTSIDERQFPGSSRGSYVNAHLYTKPGKSAYSVNYSYNNTIAQTRNIDTFTYFPSEDFTAKRSADTTRSERNIGFHSLSAGYYFQTQDWKISTSINGQINHNHSTEQQTGRTEQNQALLLASARNYNANGHSNDIHATFSVSRNFKNKSNFDLSIDYNQRSTYTADLRHQAQTTAEGTQLSDLRISSAEPNRKGSGYASYSLPSSRFGALSFNLRVQASESKDRKLYVDPQTNLLQVALSNDATDLLTQWRIGSTYGIRREKHRVSLNMNYILAPRRYDNRLFGTSERRLAHLIDGQASYSYFVDRGNLSVQLQTTPLLPEGRYFSSRIDDNNLLFLSAGNPKLKTSYDYNLELTGTIVPGTEGSLNVSLSTNITTKPIVQQLLYFKTNTELTQYNNYLALAGSTLSTPENGDYALSVAPSISYQRRIAPLACFLKIKADYSYRSTQEDTPTGFRRAQNHSAAVGLSLTSNFSTKVRIVLANRTETSWYLAATGYRDRNFKEQLNATIRWDLLKRCVFTTTYLLEVNRFESKIANSDNHILNLSFGCRMLNRKAMLSFNAYDILNQTTFLSVTQSVQGVAYKWRQGYGSYFTFAFEYKFNDRK